MTPALKAQILDRIAKIEGNSFIAFCFQVFAANAHLKTDVEVIKMITDLQEQMKDNSDVLRNTLKDQFEFFQKLSFRETARESTNAVNPI